MTVMRNVELYPNGEPIRNKKVLFKVWSAPAYSVPGAFSLEGVGEVKTNEEGYWENDFEPVDDLLPTGQVYLAEIVFRGGVVRHVFNVPDVAPIHGSEPYWIGDHLADPPDALMTAALADHILDPFAHSETLHPDLEHHDLMGLATDDALTAEAVARVNADLGLSTRVTAIEALGPLATDVEVAAAVNAAVAAEAALRAAADVALDARLDPIEALGPLATDAEVATAVAAEAAIRLTADNSLDARLDTIESLGSLATDAELNAEAAARNAADVALDGRIDAIEAVGPLASDAELSAAIASEAGIRASADTTLDARLDVIEGLGPLATDVEVAAAVAAEAAIRATADGQLSDMIVAIDGRVEDIEEVIPGLATDAELAAEITLRTNADLALDSRLDAIEAVGSLASDAEVAAAVAAEATIRQGADSSLDVRIVAIEELGPLATDAELANEATIRAAADVALDGRIDTFEALGPLATDAELAAAVASEAAIRVGADNALDARLDTIEALGPLATDAELTTAIAAEQVTRAAQIADEATARAGADATLDGRLDTIEALGPLATDAELAGAISTLNGAISDETDSRIAGDAALDTRLDAIEALGPLATDAELAAAISAEAGTRAAADTALDGRLDTIEALGPLATDAEVASAINAAITAEQATRAAQIADEATARAAADTALDGRLDTIEALGPLATDAELAGAVSTINGAITAEETDRIAGDESLDARIIPIEALGPLATDVELAAEATARIAGDTANANALTAHLSDTLDAHDASAISVSAISGLASTEVQGALAEHQAEIDAEVAARIAAIEAEEIARIAGDDALAVALAGKEPSIPPGTYVSEVSPLQYGAVGNGIADDTVPLQAALDAVIAARSSLIIDRDYRITAPLIIPESAESFRVHGDAIGRRIIQATNNTPIFKFPDTNTHNWTIDTLTLAWLNQQTFASHPLSYGFMFGNGGTLPDAYGHYQFTIKHIYFQNGCVGIGIEDPTTANPLWGWDIDDLHFGPEWAGPCMRLLNTGGSPNCRLGRVYIRADLIPATVPHLLSFNGMHGLTGGNVEVNVMNVTTALFLESSIGVQFDSVRVETATISEAYGGMVVCSGTDAILDLLEFQTIAVNVPGAWAFGISAPVASNVTIGNMRGLSITETAGQFAGLRAPANDFSVTGAVTGFNTPVFPYDGTPAALHILSEKQDSIPPGTYANAPQTVTTIDTKDYGPTTADLLAAVTDLHTAAALGPVELVIRPETYATSAQITITGLSDFTITGHSALISSSAGTTHVLALVNCHRFAVKGIGLEHSAAGARQTAADGLSIVRCTDGQVEDVRVGYVRSVSIRAQASKRINVRGCSAKGGLADGIAAYTDFVQGGANASITAGTTALSCPDGATALTDYNIGDVVVVPGAGVAGADLVTTIVDVTGTYAATLADAASTTVSGVSVIIGSGCEDIQFIGNRIENVGDDGLAVVAYTQAAGRDWTAINRRVAITGNTVKGVLDTGRGVAIVGCENFTVGDNIIENVATVGIAVTQAATQRCKNGTVSGNVVKGATTTALLVGSTSATYKVENVIVAANVVDGYGGSMIYVGGVTGGTKDVTLEGNRGRGTPTSGHGITMEHTENVAMRGNSVDGAWLAGIITDTNTGSVRVQDNDADNTNLGAAGFPGIYVTEATAVVTGNRTGDGTAINTAAVVSGIVANNLVA